MSGPLPSSSWTTKAWQAALVVLGTAVLARVAWELLKPLVPGLLVAIIVLGVISVAVRGRRF